MARILDFSDSFESSVAPAASGVSGSTITNTPSGNLAATDVQGALNELQSDIDTRATSASVALKANIASPTFTGTVAGITASMIGLGNVDNTSDATKNASTAILTNKDIDGGTAANSARITVPKAAKATLDALTRKEATIVYGTDTAKAYVDNGTALVPIGSGSGGALNYLSANSDAETDTSGYATYKDTAGALPVDGTGGTAALTFTRSTSSPLRGTANFLITHSAAGLQGEGVSALIAIDRADQGKQLYISFDYEIASGTYATGDLAIYVYDVTNAVVIQPSGYQIVNVIGQYNQAGCVFQAASNSTSYRICWHVATITASAYTMKLDNVAVGPQAASVSGAVENHVEYYSNVAQSATAGTTFAFPTKVTDPLSNYNTSTGVFLPTVAGFYFIAARLYSAGFQNLTLRKNSVVHSQGSEGTSTNVAQISNTLYFNGTTDYIEIRTEQNGTTLSARPELTRFTATLVGCSIASGSGSSRVVAMAANTSTTSATITQPFIFTSVSKDTNSAYNPATGVYTVQIPGAYLVNTTVYTGASAQALTIYINGVYTTQGLVNQSSAAPAMVADLYFLNAGDTIDVRPTSPVTASGGSSLNRFSVMMVQGPAQIQAATEVTARYSSTAGVSVTPSFTDYTFATKSHDTTGSFNGVTFIAPAPGRYRYMARVTAVGTLTTAQNLIVKAVVNGSSHADVVVVGSGVSATYSAQLVDEVDLLAGGTIKFQAYSDATLTSDTAAGRCAMSIARMAGR